MTTHKAGFVNILGNPNVGKSTIMNVLVGERISIITSKSQTTRHRIMGIVNGEDFQIVYSDTPGVIKPNYKLQESMMHYTHAAVEDADIILYVTDIFETKDKNAEFIEKVKNSNAPIILLINKIDLTTQEKVEILVEQWHNILPQAEILPLSGLHKFNVQPILKRIIELLPDSPPFFDKEQLTDKTERFFVQEIIREKILLNYQKEIPYSVEINVEEFKDTEKLLSIRAIIYVIKDSQKNIIIGNQGSAIKNVGIQARQDIEAFFGKKCFLELFVKVNANWRDNEKKLKSFGYEV